MPAFFFIAAALALLTILKERDGHRRPLMLAILCGLCIATAVLGRQNYLVMLPCLLLALDWPSPRRADIVRLALVALAAAFVTGPIFLLWRGLVPPRTASIDSGFSLANAMRSAAYTGIIAALFAPELYRMLCKRKLAMFAAAVAAVPASLLLSQPGLPLASLFAAVPGRQLAAIIGPILDYVLALFALAFLGCFAIHLWQDRTHWLTRLCGGTVLLGILSNAKISHQFSSRYVFVFLPFLVASTAGLARASWYQPLRIAIGAGVGLAALASYYFVNE